MSNSPLSQTDKATMWNGYIIEVETGAKGGDQISANALEVIEIKSDMLKRTGREIYLKEVVTIAERAIIKINSRGNTK